MKELLVSAVITTHRREPQIVERALKSILNQTYKDIEVFVVDDSPNDYEYRDSVATMVQSYAKMGVVYIPHDTCKGACAARNTGLAAAKGEFIGFLDDDDEWLPEKIEEQLKGFENDTIALVYCASKIIYEDTEVIKTGILPNIKGYVYNELLFENFIGSTSFPLIRTKVLKEIGGFDVLMQSAQDYDVWLRIAEKYEVNFVENPLVLYHFHSGDQITKNPSKKVSGLERILLKNKEGYNRNRQANINRYNILIIWYAKARMFSKAFLCWIKVLFKSPLAVKINFYNFYVILACLFRKK